MIVEVDGKRFDVPDDATVDEIDAITKPAPDVGRGEAALRGATQGASAGFADELAGVRAGIAGLNPALRGAVTGLVPALAPQGDEVVAGEQARREGKAGSWGERYRAARDKDRAANAAAKEAHRGYYTGAEIGGGLLGTAATGGAGAAAKGAGLAAKAAAGMKAGAGVGALYGAGGSESETPEGVVSDAALSALGGGVLGGALPVVGRAVQAAAGPAARWLGTRAVEAGRKALSGIGTPLSARKQIPTEVVQQALDTGAIKPFGTVTGTAKRLQGQADELGAEYGRILRDLEAAGVTGPNAELLAQEALRRAAAAGRVVSRAEKKEFTELAQDLRDAVPSTPFASRRLGLDQAEQIKRNLQEEAKREYDKITRQTTMAGEAKKQSAAMMREAIENEIAAQAQKAPQAAAEFMPIKGRLANTLSGLRVAEEGAARAARRAPPSLVPALAVGGISGSPGLGLLTLLGRLGDRRVASTVARTARGGEKAAKLIAGANLSPAQQAEASRLAAFLAALRAPRGGPALSAADEEERQ